MKKSLAFIISLIFTLSLTLSLAPKASAAESSATLPAAYNSDLSNLSYVTPVKNQGDGLGNCWAFAAIACCEADAIKNHGASPNEIDLSELHLAYFSYNGAREGTGDSVTSYQPFYTFGGYSQLPVLTLSNWIGLVDESVAPYSSLVANNSLTLDESLMQSDAEYYLHNAYFYDYTDIAAVKEAITEYGAVQTAYYSSENYLNDLTYAHYTPTAYTSDHAIAIVGWNDGYAKENFNSTCQPSNNGAWLAKNSWGDAWGNDGYFWISYEDKSIISLTAFDVIPASEEKYHNNYQHDGGISLSYLDQSNLSFANIFCANGNEELLSIGVTVYEKRNASYELEIYINPTTLSPQKFNEGAPVHTQSGTLAEPGFNTIELTESVVLNENDVFIICLKTDAYVACDANYNIRNSYSTLAYSSAGVLQNQTYVSAGSGFYDVATQSGSSLYNARIKAFTKNLVLGEAQFLSLPTVSTLKYGQSLSDATFSGGKITDSLSGKSIRGSWSFKNASFIPKNGDTATLVFTPDSSHYDTIEKTVTLSVEADKPTLTISPDKQSYKGGDVLSVSTVLKNAYSSSLSDLPSVSYTYKINLGEEIPFVNSFTLPDDIGGLTITIKAVTEAVDGKYSSAKDLIVLTISSDADNGTGESTDPTLPTSPDSNGSETQTNQEIPSVDTSQDTQQNGAEQAHLSPEQEIDPADEIEEFSLGCSMSASLSTLAAICAIGALCSLKKKKR